MAWTPLAPSNYLHTKEAKDPKETDREEIRSFMGMLITWSFFFLFIFVAWTGSKIKKLHLRQ